MAYPVSYRERGPAQYTPAPRPGGFQTPVPANDNSPTPANDNAPRRPPTPRQQVQAAINVARVARQVRSIGGAAVRVSPVAAAFFVWDLIDYWEYQNDRHRETDQVPWNPGVINFAGYVPDTDCGRRPELFYGKLGYPNCGSVDLVLNAKSWDVTGLPATITAFQHRRYWVDGVTHRGDPAKSWKLVHGSTKRPYQAQTKSGSTTKPVAPTLPTWVDPFGAPIGVPLPTPMPPPWWVQPYRRPNPYRSPTYQTIRGDAGPKPIKDTPRRPPPTGEKEKKVKPTKGIVGKFRSIAHTLSEFSDLTDAIWKALPLNRQVKGASGAEKIQAIYRYYDEIDPNQMLLNMWQMDRQDQVWGQAHSRIDEWLKSSVSGYTGNARGVTLGEILG